VQENNAVKQARSFRRTLLISPLRTGGWQITDSAGRVGGFFRDRSAALKSVVRERWSKDAIIELSVESLEQPSDVPAVANDRGLPAYSRLSQLLLALLLLLTVAAMIWTFVQLARA
jgi:hypothetical protein